jgi:Zn-dependent protease with chaperone function
MSINACYFDGKTSTAHPVQLSFFGDGRLSVAGDGVERTASVSDLKVSERVGDTTRRIYFSDGAVCEATDNDFIDQWLTHLGAHSAEHRVFRFERGWRYAFAALILTVAGSWVFIRYGVPAAADYAARVLPRSVDSAIGKGGLEAMDALWFEPSKRSMAQQTQVHALFERMKRDMNTGLDLRLELRRSEAVGPNAFALPSGIIVMTDQLVAVAAHSEEIESVLAHEVGHIAHRHSLRMLLQSSASALLMFTLLGDVNSASTLAASIPAVLVHARHSRDFEREADEYSFVWLHERGIPNHRFGDILKRIEQAHGREQDEKGGVMTYFSSHPRTAERTREEVE